MIDPIVASAIEEAKAEGVFRPVLHLIVNGYVLSDEDAAAIAALPINRGKRPGKETLESHLQQARFWNEFCDAKRGRGPKAVKRALEVTLPHFPGLTENVALDIIGSHRPKIRALAKKLRTDR